MTTQVMELVRSAQGTAEPKKRTQFTKILLMTDFSDVSALALEYALAIARRYDASIYVAHVITPDAYRMAEPAVAQMTYENIRQAAEQSIADILVSGKLRGVPHEVLLEEGLLWPTAERLIQEHAIDLVLVGTHGRGQFKKMILGSVAEEVFRQVGCAVLTVGPRATAGVPLEVNLRNILFATDFGAGAKQAGQYAFSLAQEHGADLTMLHVVEAGREYTEEQEQQIRREHIAWMKGEMPAGADDWCNVTFRVAFGKASEEILEEAHDTKADLIVMGAKTAKGFAGHAPRTIAYNVVAKAKCPVLTVRGRWE